MSKDKDIFGWGYEFSMYPYDENREDIISFSEKIDHDLDCTGCGFMLAFFHFSNDSLQRIYKEYGYFPYDGYLTLWDKFTNQSFGYNQRNKAIATLVENKMLGSPTKDIFQAVDNPFTKIINRKNNLGKLLPN